MTAQLYQPNANLPKWIWPLLARRRSRESRRQKPDEV